MYKRDLEEILKKYEHLPILVFLGPRHAGKTTLIKSVFKKHVYLSFGDPQTRSLAQNDPHKFLHMHENKCGLVIDEFHHVPELVSCIRSKTDQNKTPGYFILISSYNFLTNQIITQSLVGRASILTLLPMSMHELNKNNLLAKNIDHAIFNGGYPRVHAGSFSPTQLHSAYIQSFVERDLRLITNIDDLCTFQHFIQLCVGQIGQLLNLSQLASASGVSVSTARRWILLLKSSYILFLLQPHSKNFNKRLTKSPKIYFYDTGLTCSLLDIKSPDFLALHPLRGKIFENFIITDLCKQYFNIGKRPPIYFWRDLNGRLEIDCVIEEKNTLLPIAIKSGEALTPDDFINLKKFNTLNDTNPQDTYVIYGGTETQKRSVGNGIGWNSTSKMAIKPRQ